MVDLAAENARLKKVVKELAGAIIYSDNTPPKSVEEIRLYDSGCGCCSDSYSYASALKEEIEQPKYKYQPFTALVYQVVFEVLNEE